MMRHTRPDLRAVLFGHPVGHSRSPELFSALANSGGPRVDFQLLDVPPQRLADALDRLRGGEWQAAGVTIPYKQAVADLVDEVAGEARSINAIARREDGRLVGTNTDGPGFLRALHGHSPQLPASAVILGGGGAARGVAASLQGQGVSVTIVTRDPAGRAGLGDRVISWQDTDLIEIVRSVELVVQATSLGMFPHTEGCPPLPVQAIRPGHQVVDLIYTPWQTRFLQRARSQGAVALNGWPMLVHQAAVALDFWLGAGAGAGLEAAVAAVEPRDPTRGTGDRTRAAEG